MRHLTTPHSTTQVVLFDYATPGSEIVKKIDYLRPGCGIVKVDYLRPGCGIVKVDYLGPGCGIVKFDYIRIIIDYVTITVDYLKIFSRCQLHCAVLQSAWLAPFVGSPR